MQVKNFVRSSRLKIKDQHKHDLFYQEPTCNEDHLDETERSIIGR